MSKPEVILKVVYIDTSKTEKKIRQARILVDNVLDMLKVCRYPIDQIKVEIR